MNLTIAFLLLVTLTATSPFSSDHCTGLQADYHFLDYHKVETGGKSNPDRMGDFDFCLPESRTLLRHSLVPRLTDNEYWELFIRDKDLHRIGSAALTLDHSFYRLKCYNGTYLLYSNGEVSRSPNWTENEVGGASHVYTDSNHPSENLIFGFQCLLTTPKPQKPQLQGLCLRRFCCLWNLGVTHEWKGAEYLEGWHHPVHPSRPPSWDHVGPLRCGGIARDRRLLNTTDPLHPLGTAPRQLGADPALPGEDLLSSWEQNSYIKLLSQVAKEAPYPDCWICAHAPSHLQQSLPLVPVPVTLEQFRSGDVTSWNLTALNLTHQYLYLTGPTKGPLCRSFTGEGTFIGSSTCNSDLEILATGQVTVTDLGGSQTFPNLTIAWATVVGHLTPQLEASTHGLYAITDFCIWENGVLPQRLILGVRTPRIHLGYIVPGIRVVPHLPPGRQRNKRDQKGLSDLSDVAANGETVGRALFPAYGAGSNHVDILRLTDILLKFMQEATQITDSLMSELSERRRLEIAEELSGSGSSGLGTRSSSASSSGAFQTSQQASAKGSISIEDVDPEGKYVQLKNRSDKPSASGEMDKLSTKGQIRNPFVVSPQNPLRKQENQVAHSKFRSSMAPFFEFSPA
ncbi:Hypothetical predicted protein [Podarcis lilfordi]|uniref:Uncharacterized protein n=1 Tax=Podarcis lilfordi TaxID=74358 RepID=A0AA35LM32_9SAUR|nr:Hypothetical predicted protein [Podarcis lilfordi]